MDFKLVFEKLITFFRENNVRYALMGGFAIGAQGIVRSTVDIDFLIHRDDVSIVHSFMTDLGYERRYNSENVSQYTSSDKLMGEVDFIHAFRDASVAMLERAEEKRIFNQILAVKVLNVEDIIGFKVQAIANDPSRKNSDLADIEALINLHKKSLDWNTVGNFFSLFGFKDLFKELKNRYCS